MTAISQVTYAFGPGVIGLLRDLSGSYTVPFYACIALELMAAALIMVRARAVVTASVARMERSDIRARMRCGHAVTCAALAMTELQATRCRSSPPVEPPGVHLERAVRFSRPLSSAVPIELDAVLVGIAQIERLADAVVAGAVERDAGGDQPPQRVGERGPGRIEDRGVEEAGGAGRRRMAALALPGVEADMVVIAAGRDEGRLRRSAASARSRARRNRRRERDRGRPP